MALSIKSALKVRQFARVCLWGTPKSGKAQPLDAKILTPTGWRLMGEVQVGDEVINSQGGTSHVLGVFPQGEKDIYKVIMNDGASTECCDDHLWFTQTRTDISTPRRKGRPQSRSGTVKSLHDIRATLIYGGGVSKKYNHSVPLVRPIEFVEGAPLAINPYLFGVLLGDGSFQPSSVVVTSADEEIQNSIRELLPIGTKMQQLRQDNEIDFALRRTRTSGNNLVLDEVRACGLEGKNSKEKFIPDRYKFASIADRIALLQGLLDTDGYTQGCTLEYSTSSSDLAGDVQFLVESLGGKAHISKRIPHYTHKGEYHAGVVSYRLYVTLPPNIVPFRLSRKIALYKPRTKITVGHTIVKIEYVGKKEAQCIAVDAPDHLYVTDHCILTHNTHSALMLATTLAGEGGKVGVISSEYGSSKLLSHKFPHDIIDLAEPDELGNPVRGAFSPSRYEEALRLFVENGYKAVVIDSLSHVWEGEGGILEAVGKAGKNSFSDGWKDNSPVYKHLVNAILSARCHVIITLRAKDAYVVEQVESKGYIKSVPRNVGQAPVIRKDFGFEMQLTIRMDSMVANVEASAVEDHIHKGEEIEKPGPELAYRLLDALDGVELPEPTPQQKEMRRLLDEFYALSPATYARIANWQDIALRKALELADGESVPTEYTDDDVARMDLYVTQKRKEKTQKAS